MRVAWLLAVAAARAVAPGERLGSRSGRRAARASATESYAVLMYGHHGHTMGAVVLGTLLRRVDPDRARTALVANISAAAREALSSGGLWSLSLYSWKLSRLFPGLFSNKLLVVSLLDISRKEEL